VLLSNVILRLQRFTLLPHIGLNRMRNTQRTGALMTKKNQIRIYINNLLKDSHPLILN